MNIEQIKKSGIKGEKLVLDVSREGSVVYVKIIDQPICFWNSDDFYIENRETRFVSSSKFVIESSSFLEIAPNSRLADVMEGPAKNTLFLHGYSSGHDNLESAAARKFYGENEAIEYIKLLEKAVTEFNIHFGYEKPQNSVPEFFD